MTWQTLSSKIVYHNPWIKIQEDQVIQPNGNNSLYGFLIKVPGVFVIAETEFEEIYLIEEYRYPLKKNILQLPSGIIEGKLSPEATAAKELFEETGIRASNFQNLGKFYIAPGHETTEIYAVKATGLEISEFGIHQEGDESIQNIKKFAIDEVKQMIISNKISCGLTLAALNLYFCNQEK
ncbi:MAG: NUDIX hydrolase [bacterium]